jgi:hypothetical protein
MGSSIWRAAALLALAPSASRAAVAEDEVTSLPGFAGALPTRHWSGYIEVPAIDTDNKTARAFVHYWLIENAAKDPSAPTVVWQQGAPPLPLAVVGWNSPSSPAPHRSPIGRCVTPPVLESDA